MLRVESRVKANRRYTRSHTYTIADVRTCTCATNVLARALINAAFLGPPPNSTPHNVSRRSCIPRRTFRGGIHSSGCIKPL